MKRLHYRAIWDTIAPYTMEWFLSIVTENAAHAHWWVFGALMLAGLNLPISEELVLLVGGVAASSVEATGTLKIYLFIFAGAYASDWMVYFFGRLLGPRLWRIAWFRRTIKQHRLKQMEIGRASCRERV